MTMSNKESSPKYVGPSIIEQFWLELDILMERIMTKQEAEDGLDRGRAENAMYFLAILSNPYSPSIMNIKTEAVRRFKEKL